MTLDPYDLLECDRRPTALGEALRVRIHRRDLAPMGWRELWEVFSAAYPGRWAVQVLPPADRLIDQVAKYHLFILPDAPHGLDIAASAPRGTVGPEAP
jgi:hypothetical protein